MRIIRAQNAAGLTDIRMEYLLGSSDDDTPRKQSTQGDIDRNAIEDDDAELRLLASTPNQ